MPKKYPEHEKEKALIAAATLGMRPASRQLGIPYETIREWIKHEPARYAEIREQEASKWRARASAEFEDIVDGLSELERAATRKLADEIDTLEGRDLANALKAISTSKGINTQHVHTLRGQPSQVIEHRYDLAAIERAIRATENVIEGTAEEIPPTTTGAAPEDGSCADG